jgi:hypothetical protein
MNVKSLFEQVKPSIIRKDLLRTLKNPPVIYDLFKPTIIFDIKDLQTYVVKREEEMRIDLLFQNIYELESSIIMEYLSEIDIILTLNNIDNPLNIKEGMSILYPPIGALYKYRKMDTDGEKSKEKISKKLAVPNKQTKEDPSRKSYVENGYSLPPTVNSKPTPSVRFDNKNNKLSVGGF